MRPTSAAGRISHTPKTTLVFKKHEKRATQSKGVKQFGGFVEEFFLLEIPAPRAAERGEQLMMLRSLCIIFCTPPAHNVIEYIYF
jgi:hypothetical protein